MKIRLALGLCAALGTGFISVRAADNPAQAAARVALERVLNSSDDSQVQSPPATNTLPEAAVEQPGISATTVTGTVPENAVTPQTAPVATNPVAAPAPVAPVAASHTPVAPAAASDMPFLMLWCLLLSLLVISFVTMAILLLKHPNVAAHTGAAPSEIQPAATKTSPSTEKQSLKAKC